VLRDGTNPRKKRPDAVIIATGSEVGLAVGAADALAVEGVHVRVVSVPSTTVFDKQDAAYKASVLPAGVPRIAVEAGVTDFWWKYQVQAVVGIDTFGESARQACCSSTSASPWRTWPTRCAPRSPSNSRPRGMPVRGAGCGAGPFIDCTLGDRHDHQDRHQRLWPHRAHGVPRRRRELQGH
jgi:hypothetical protein